MRLYPLGTTVGLALALMMTSAATAQTPDWQLRCSIQDVPGAKEAIENLVATVKNSPVEVAYLADLCELDRRFPDETVHSADRLIIWNHAARAAYGDNPPPGVLSLEVDVSQRHAWDALFKEINIEDGYRDDFLYEFKRAVYSVTRIGPRKPVRDDHEQRKAVMDTAVSPAEFPFVYNNDGLITLRSADLNTALTLFEGEKARWINETEIAYLQRKGTDPVGRILVYNVQTAERRRLQRASEFEFSPDGTQYTFKGPLGLLTLNSETGASTLLGGGGDVQWIDNNSLLFRERDETRIYNGIRLDDLISDVEFVGVSPDGSRIAYAQTTGVAASTTDAFIEIPSDQLEMSLGTTALYVADITGANAERVFTYDIMANGPYRWIIGHVLWSPDGNNIAFIQFLSSDARSEMAFFAEGTEYSVVIHDTNTNENRRLQRAVKNVYSFEWSPDSQHILFSRLVESLMSDN